MAFNPTSYKDMYSRFAVELGVTVTLMVNNGSGFDEYPNVRAFKRGSKPDELVDGGSIQQNDIWLIILADDIPPGLRRLERKDRIKMSDGRPRSVEQWDDQTRTVGSTDVAINARIRG